MKLYKTLGMLAGLGLAQQGFADEPMVEGGPDLEKITRRCRVVENNLSVLCGNSKAWVLYRRIPLGRESFLETATWGGEAPLFGYSKTTIMTYANGDLAHIFVGFTNEDPYKSGILHNAGHDSGRWNFTFTVTPGDDLEAEQAAAYLLLYEDIGDRLSPLLEDNKTKEPKSETD